MSNHTAIKSNTTIDNDDTGFGDKSFVEPQYNSMHELYARGSNVLGLMAGAMWQRDPKRLGILLARYKFVGKMLDGKTSVLELGCSDAFASRIVKQHVEKLTVSDFDPLFIEAAKKIADKHWPMEYLLHNMVTEPTQTRYDAIYALDVFEHIEKSYSGAFLTNIIKSLNPAGVLLLGIPSLESQAFGTPESRAGHVNCLSGTDFKAYLGKYFNNTFVFSMNDEVIHTGFYPMAHYLMAICTSPK